MNSKKAQSEIITTVLIILLVLAAIIIVWQVVQSTLKNTSNDIDVGAACVGLQTEVVSAKSAETLGTCSDTTKTKKADCVVPALWTNAANGKVVVQRSAGTMDASMSVTAKIYVNGKDTGVQTGSLSPLATEEVNVADLTTPGLKVKAVTILTKGDKTAACGTAVESVSV